MGQEVIKSDKMPSAIPYIIGNEAAERFNYYGLRAILTTFLVAQFYNPTKSIDPTFMQTAEATANAKTHDFVAMCYLLPMFGGMIADWFWGKYKTILVLSIVYAIGNLCLAAFVDNESIFLSALMLIAVGAGGIKPCVSANVGDQFDESNSHLINKAFNAFYAAINAGSLFSILIIPYLNSHYGPRMAFGVPAIAMCVATAFFYAGRNKYVRKPPKGDENKSVVFGTAFGTLVISYLVFDRFSKDIFGDKFEGGTGPILAGWAIMILLMVGIFRKQWFAKPGNFIGISLYALFNGGFDKATNEYGEKAIDGIRSVWRVLSVFAFIPVFWALWDQSQSEWVIQAKKCDLNLGFWGLKWEAEQLSAVNAGFILMLIPIFNFGIFPLIEKLGVKVTPFRKIGAGLVLTALSFVVIAYLQQPIDDLMAQVKANGTTYESLADSAKPSIYWQAFAFFILTAGEVLVSITCLEYAYTQAPPSMKSTIMACYLLSVTLGNVLVSVIQNNIKGGGYFAQFKGASFFWLFTGICAVTAVLFMLISPRIKEKSYIGVVE
jgi:proton-dependent oligopeptide transporter, POT family